MMHSHMVLLKPVLLVLYCLILLEELTTIMLFIDKLNLWYLLMLLHLQLDCTLRCMNGDLTLFHTPTTSEYHK
jgi:hypothetical protein